MKNTRPELSPSEIVEYFPNCKSVVRRLIKENEKFIEEAAEAEIDIRNSLANEVSMFDTDLLRVLTRLGMILVYGNSVEVAKERLKFQQRLLSYYDPKEPAKEGGITELDIERARQFPIRELLDVKRNLALCPFHADTKPSFHVYKDNHGYCFSCNKRADVIDIYKVLHRVDFVTAVKSLL